MINKELNDWEKASDNLANFFAKKYFGKDVEQWWVGDCTGDVYYINDRFFSISDMVDFIRHKYSAKMMFEYYDQKLACDMKDKEWRYNIKNYKK
jgi:hypothetical protein